MKNIIITSLFVMVSMNLFSQEDIYNHKFTINSQYLLVKFINGKVKFDDGYEINAKLNYNVLLEKMHFLENDTIKTLTSIDIKYIMLDKFKFIRINGEFFQEIYNTKNLKLVFQYNADISSINTNKGSYGQSTETVASMKMSYFPTQVNERGYVALEDDQAEEIKTNPQYYIIDSNNHLIPPTKKKIQKLSKKSKSEIESYMKENTVNLNKKEDLIKILDFL